MAFYFCSFLALRFFHSTHNGPATNIEEIQPESNPNTIGIAKVRNEESPYSSETTMIVSTANTVLEIQV